LRRVIAILPFFLTALLAQIYAPVGSALALGRASDTVAFAAAPCAGAGDRRAPHTPGACCDLCEFVLSGAAPLAAAPPPLAARSAPARRIVWRMAAVRLAPSRPPRTFRARAPPFAS
jgi:hypothetical protein